MPLTQYLEKAMLDWCLGGATPTRPSAWYLQYATGSPNVSGASDGPFTPRATVSASPANSPAGSVLINAASVPATATAIATALGWNIYDASVGGNRLMFGTLTASVGCASGDSIQMNFPSVCKITLA